MSHTPGPWKVYDRWYIRREGPDACGAHAEVVKPSTVGAFALVKSRVFPAMTEAEHEANARLIAAAPDLLAACEAARRQMTNERYNKPRIGMEAECAMCDAAIAKARTV